MNNRCDDSQLAAFRKALRKSSNPERAEKEKAYLKSPYMFFGVPVPSIEKVAKAYRIKLLKQYPQLLDIRCMPMLERMLSECTGWDHVDGIAIHLVGHVLGKDKKACSYLVKWKSSGNFWMRRASLISQITLFRKSGGDHHLFFSLAEEMLEDREFFIRKAIGWTVREISKADPGAAFDYLMSIRDRASGLTLREGSRGLAEQQRLRVMKG
jgi:3-methyladenine DNA glycosylase AlkD